MKGKIELMAPAGSYQALEAAVNAGADAVYLGGSSFGARQYANNFDREELKKAVEFSHLRGVRIYVTVNILVADSEVGALADYLLFLYNVGVDAIIVQDLGVYAIAKQLIPDMPLFASTQLTVTDSKSVALAERLGFSRVVLPREASLENIRAICRQANCEIEVFVHGALCMSYSGQCLMSSLIGARSGNRGQCAQPCRLPYILADEDFNEVLTQDEAGKYLLSPRDLNVIELLPELITAGVTSFKIEGRMKRPEYVATVTNIYRQAIDSFLAGDFDVPAEAHKDLRQIFNRDFTTGYFLERQGRALLSDRRPNNRGVQIGRVSAFDKKDKWLEIKLEEAICEGDELDIWVKVGGRSGLKAESMQVGGKFVKSADKGETVRFSFNQSVSVSDRVFRTFDASLTQHARAFFDRPTSTLPVHAYVEAKEGQPLSVVFTDEDGNKGEGGTDFVAELAKKHPLTVQTVEKQLQRLGDTDFYLAGFEAALQDGIMVPVSEINKARRQAIDCLKQVRIDRFLVRTQLTATKLHYPEKIEQIKEKTSLTVHVDSIEKLQPVLEAGADILIFGGESYGHQQIGTKHYKEAYNICKNNGKAIYFATPRIIMQEEQQEFLELAEAFCAIKPDGILVGSLSAFEILHDKGLPLWIDYSLNVFNNFALDFWRLQNVQGVTLSQEMNFNQLAQINGILPLECMVHGRTEMMITQYCALGALLGNGQKGSCSAPCRKDKYFFKDRKGEHFPLVTDQFCRMHVLNAKELCLLDQLDKFVAAGIKRLRIDGRFFTSMQLKGIVADYKRVLAGGQPDARDNITRGHYFRGVI